MKPDPETVALYETASAWFTRRQARQEWSAQTEADLQAWLQADPRHRHAYQEIAQIWGAFDHVARPVLASDVQRVVPPRRRSATAQVRQPVPALRAGRRWSWPFGSGRGAGVAALCVCLVVGLGAWYWYDNTPQFTERIQTAHGEQREVNLPDGTVLTVNMASHLDVLFYPRRREVSLVQGEAFFNVAGRGGDAFVVQAGNTQVRVVGTAFNVRAGSTALYVKVREGAVEVASRGNGRDHAERLGAGDTAQVDAFTGVQQRHSSAPDVAGSWRTGQLMFRNATLSEVVDELQGYLGQPIELVGGEMRHRRLSGFASTKDPQDFLNALPQLLPVEVTRLQEGGYRIVAR